MILNMICRFLLYVLLSSNAVCVEAPMMRTKHARYSVRLLYGLLPQNDSPTESSSRYNHPILLIPWRTTRKMLMKNKGTYTTSSAMEMSPRASRAIVRVYRRPLCVEEGTC